VVMIGRVEDRLRHVHQRGGKLWHRSEHCSASRTLAKK
jgi:hypothetical protein